MCGMANQQEFEVIVVGGGHAGTEAALAAARTGAHTLLLTHSIETVGQMSCNPAIGGIGKSHLVREIDALGGIMAQAADCAGIHFRVLNSRKGPAVRATRAQTDRALYRNAVRRLVERQANLMLFQQAADDLIIENDRVCGVKTGMGLTFKAQTVVLTTGTFLGGRIHIGANNHGGGRAGDAPTIALAARLRELMPNVGRLKTGTPPRIDGATLDYARFATQPGDSPRPVFSFIGNRDQHPEQRLCHIARTNEKTHTIIREALHQSPMFNGAIESVGPRYCPSIEDKVTQFADKSSHQIFIEPEGLNTDEVYPNGISTSLPFATQLAMVQSVKGFENAHITRPGYAIEYDYFEPRGLRPWLETRAVKGLFFAGQINGTTGYEEAAAQGLIAGLNAGRTVRGLAPWYPRRDEAYIGVLIDDLVTRGTTEPYRMFTSRAEYRMLLRHDNADARLTPKGRELGLVDDRRWRLFNNKMERIEKEQARLAALKITPQDASARDINLKNTCAATELLRRPGIRYADIAALAQLPDPLSDEQAIEQLEATAAYAGYLPRQEQEIRRMADAEQTAIPQDFDYANISGLSEELRGKLLRFKPATLGQAGRIQGITPCALSLLQLHIKSHHAKVRAG